MIHSRKRYQHGSLTLEERKDAPAVWVYRWRQPVAGRKPIRHKKILGTATEIKSQSAAEKVAAAMRADINALGNAPAVAMSVADVIDHFNLVELPNGNRSHRTRETYTSYITNTILPKWGNSQMSEVKTVIVERWLAGLTGAPATLLA